MFQPIQTEEFDVVVVGCGPAGATTGYHLAKQGLRVLALERHVFPRYHIGESLTGVVAERLDEMGLYHDMARRGFPEKSGVKVVGRNAKSEFFVPVLTPTWQVRRDEFDQMLLDRAIDAGVIHRYGSVKRVLRERECVVGVGYRPRGDDTDLLREVRARMVIDASGHSALMSRHGIAGTRQVDAFGHQIAVFTQVTGAVRDDGPMGNNTVIFYEKKHHWGWFIPLSDELVSIGIVVPTKTYKEVASSPRELMKWAVENINPDLKQRLSNAHATEPVRTVANYSYRIEPYAGPGWLCVGDSHRFADPVFSFGVAFAMCEAVAAAAATQEALERGAFDEPLARYTEYCDRGHTAAYDLIRFFWRYPAFFPYQVRGDYQHDMMRLFSGDFFRKGDIPALTAMRRSLSQFDEDAIADGRARAIAARVHGLYADFQGIESAYLDIADESLCVSFVLTDDRLELYEHMYKIEESLYREFGDAPIAVRAFTRRAGNDGLRLVRHVGGRGLEPSLEAAHAIFDHRSQP